MIDEKDIEEIYKESIKLIEEESIEKLQNRPFSNQFNREMVYRHQFNTMNEQRKQDSEKIKNLEQQVQQIQLELSKLSGKIQNN